MPRLVYSANYLIEANKTNIVPQVVGMVEISSGGFAPGTITAHATFPLPSPYNYDGRLRDVSSIDCSLNGAYGRVSFAITNADLGEVANVAADKYVGWECKVHKIIILEDGTLLGILLLHGVITSYTMTDRVVDMDVVTRINVGNTITPRRVNVKCPWVFKGTECGYSGVLTTCNKLYTDADGCSGRSNQHRFGGFPLRLPEASIGAVSGQGGAPTYQLIRDDSAFQLQRAILEFDNTFSVTDDPTNNKTVISVTGGGGGGSGTVTSVALSAPSFLTVTGSPVTTSGTLAVTLATQNANTVFAGPTTGSAAAPTFRALVAGDIPDLSSIYQPLDADLTAIAALTANGLLRKTAGTWAMDSAVYLTANQTITLSGDVTGSGSTSIATTIANAAVTFAKMQSIATGRLLGRTTASTGPIEEITPGSGVLTWLQTPSSANLAAAVTDETGSGALVFATSPTLVTPNIGVATGTSFNSITGLSSTTPSATVTTTAVVGTATAAARADHVHSIADDAVTYAKMQDVSAASRLLGRGSASGSGDVQEITVGGGIEFTSSTGIQTTALTGDVTKTAGGTSTTIANDAVTTAKVANAAITPAKLSGVAQSLSGRNLLINGSMQILQRVRLASYEPVTLSTTQASTLTAFSIPANAFVFRVRGSITTSIVGINSTSLQFGTAANNTLFGSITAFTAGTTFDFFPNTLFASAAQVQMTLAGGADNIPTPPPPPPTVSAGVVDITVEYIQIVTGIGSTLTNGYHTADRWRTQINSAGTWTQSIELDAPAGSEFRNSLKMTCTTANSSLDTGDQLVIQQRLEGQNLQGIRKGTSNANQLTLSFWVKSGTTGTYIAELHDNDNTRFVSASYSVNTTNTWEKKTITFPADTSGILNNDNEFSLAVNFWLVAGSTFTGGTPLQTTWGTTTNTRATGQLNLSSGQVAGTNYWQITGVQLEIGSTATEFELIAIERLTLQCQRYLPMIDCNKPTAILYNNAFGGIRTATTGVCLFYYPVPPRARPTAHVISNLNDFYLIDLATNQTGTPSSIVAASGGRAYGNETALLTFTVTTNNLGVTPTFQLGAVCFMGYRNTNGFIYFDGCEL
jgi:hypothetical protein